MNILIPDLAQNILAPLIRLPAVVYLLGIVRSRIIHLSARLGKPAPAGYDVVINTTGAGNIGDQALFESFLANVPGPVVAVCESRLSFVVPDECADRVTIRALGSLTYGWGLSHLRDLWALGRIIRSAEAVWITGADIMDGAYNQRISSTGWMIALAARAQKLPTRVLGFSWNDHPDPGILRLARRAGRAGVMLCARDHQSFARLVADRVTGVEQVADIAFLLGDAEPLPAEIEASVQAWRDPQKRLAIVNISGLISLNHELDTDYRQVIDQLRRADYQVLIVPHVMRQGNDDLAAADRILAVGEFDDVHTIRRLLAPRQILQLASRADLVFSGRMHLAVLALSQGVPVIVMSTQGKVSGLVDMFSIPHHSIAPLPGFAEVVRPLLSPESLEIFHQNHTDGLLLATSLARLNFSRRGALRGARAGGVDD